MTVPFSIEWKLVTGGNEQRVEDRENFFSIVLDGYQLFPMEEQIEIQRNQSSDLIGFGKVVELTWKNNQTICTYQLVSLHSVN
ncbi:DUF2584 family protein [Paraliobacillus salinarum]|uniref:DUF2584 family protein n=1 Tax=Paraliobacillus salinarum TaxID=1158996 RepID=UPI0015F710BE|nr:DUF2584 family protein [Paraliobacillus salinarum]